MFQMRANIVAMGTIGAALLLPGLAQADQTGHGSWYALHSRTASGEMNQALTAAHRRCPSAQGAGGASPTALVVV